MAHFMYLNLRSLVEVAYGLTQTQIGAERNQGSAFTFSGKIAWAYGNGIVLFYGSRFIWTSSQETIGRRKFVLRSGAEKCVPG